MHCISNHDVYTGDMIELEDVSVLGETYLVTDMPLETE